MQEFRRYFSPELRKRLNPGTPAAYKYGFGALLVLTAIIVLPAFRTIPEAAPAAVPLSPARISAASRHSTLSIDLFQQFVSRNGQRMYPRLSREIVDSTIKYSQKYDLSPVLVLAITATESEFYPFALSKQNAKGLMQINPQANQELLLKEGIFKEPGDIFDPDRNIEAGCFLLRRFLDESHDFDTALDKYLGANSASYKGQIHAVMGQILLMGISKDLNRTSQNVETMVKAEMH